MADKPGGQHPGVVEHQTVPGAKELGQIIKMVVAGLTGPLVQRQQPGGVPPVQRGLGNQFLRKVKVKIRSFQW